MTPNQRLFYFKLWQKVAQAHDWIMVQRRLLGRREEKFGREESSRLYNAIWDAAEILAQNNHRSVTADDLRHACHLVAIFPQKAASKQKLAPISSKDISNKQLDRVIALFRVLINPNDIAASIAWSDPSVGEKQRLIYVIKNAAPLAYIDSICRDKFGLLYTSPFYEDLELNELRQLAMTLRNRQVGTVAPRGPSGPIDISKNLPVSETDPF
jgi:hypothetical protein